jgi:NADH:ubiquinone reductase (H+-translocating)
MVRVIILGGGFGGVFTAKNLLNKKNIEVVLISKTNYFLFTPLLHEVACGSINRHTICEPIRDVLKGDNFKFYRAQVDKVDATNKTVYFGKNKLDYDFLVIAIGSESFTFNIPGVKENALKLKSIRDSIEIRGSLIKSLESANLSKNKRNIEKYLNFVVIGAGATGVELAGEISDIIKDNLQNRFGHLKKYKPKVHLIQASSDILPIMSKKSIKNARKILKKKDVKVYTNTFVSEVLVDEVKTKTGLSIKSSTIIWSGGVKPRAIKTVPKLQDEKGFFRVNKNLQVKNFPEIFALGDVSHIESEPVPMLAQVAMQQSIIVSKNIINLVEGNNLDEFKFKNKGILVSIGEFKVIGDIFNGKLSVKGSFWWFVKRTIYIMNMIGLRNKIRVGIEWFINLIFSRDTSEI